MLLRVTVQKDDQTEVRETHTVKNHRQAITLLSLAATMAALIRWGAGSKVHVEMLVVVGAGREVHSRTIEPMSLPVRFDELQEMMDTIMAAAMAVQQEGVN
jgi:hypothetical protein